MADLNVINHGLQHTPWLMTVHAVVNVETTISQRMTRTVCKIT